MSIIFQRLQPCLSEIAMNDFTAATGTPVSVCCAVYCLINIPPVVNYLLSPLMEQDLVKKRANAVAFTQGMAAVARRYWQQDVIGPVDLTAPATAYRKIHRTVFTPAHTAIKQMYSILQDAVDKPNFFDDLGGNWVALSNVTKTETVQQLMNSSNVEGLPHLIFVRLDRGDRPRRFINYGTSMKVVKNTEKANYIHFHNYELVCVLVEGGDDDGAFVRDRNRQGWQHYESASMAVNPVADLNLLVSVRAQVLVYLRQV